MATILYLATDCGLAVARRQNGTWGVQLGLAGLVAQCVAADPERPERVYCGTFDRGLWTSGDAGTSWRAAGPGIAHPAVMAVAVSTLERVDSIAVVWAGTEPSALFRSDDGGRSWRECPTLRSLPSAPTWSFPPRPWTSHVRWIAPDAHEATWLFVGIELGGVMRSMDSGQSWEDRKPGGQHDAHTLRTHPGAPGWVYEASGGGYAESHDAGASWRREDEGLRHRYTWGLAVDPADPETIVISAADGPRQAHDAGAAESHLYRRTAGEPWKEVSDGLPGPQGTRTLVLATNAAEPHSFYAATRDGQVFRSADAGRSWEPLPLSWPEGHRVGNVEALCVAEV
jgi:photosystem II stability/assembly factor-like uncharacterized protein